MKNLWFKMNHMVNKNKVPHRLKALDKWKNSKKMKELLNKKRFQPLMQVSLLGKILFREMTKLISNIVNKSQNLGYIIALNPAIDLWLC